MEMPFRALFAVPWFGEETTHQADPVNRTISVWLGCVASPTLPTAHHSLADTKATAESSPPEVGGAARLKEPHVEVAARPASAPRTSDTVSRPGNVLAAVAAAPATATPTTKLRRDTAGGL
jgi:hypothetical protein